MEKDNYITEVIFRKEKNNQIVAVFPYEIADLKGNVMCYAHIGQHSGGDYSYFAYDCKPVKESDYNDLKIELETGYGYNFKVIKKQNYERYLKEYYKVINQNK